jgi:DNA-binding beta-propeller fold protein YncE
MVLSPDGATVYVATEQSPGGGFGGAVTPVSLRTGALGRTVSVGWRPTSLAITPDGRTLYAAIDGTYGEGEQVRHNSVTLIDTATGRVRTSLPWQAPPENLEMTPAGKTVWVVSAISDTPGTAENTVTPITVPGNRPGPSSRTSGWRNSCENEPTGATMSPDGKTLYITVISGLETFRLSLTTRRSRRTRDLAIAAMRCYRAALRGAAVTRAACRIPVLGGLARRMRRRPLTSASFPARRHAASPTLVTGKRLVPPIWLAA